MRAGIVIDYNDFDLHKRFEQDLEPIVFYLNKTLGKLGDKPQRISLKFRIIRNSIDEFDYYEEDSILDYVKVSPTYSRYYIDYPLRPYLYFDGKEKLNIHNDTSLKNKISLLLSDPNLTNKEKLDIENVSNVIMFCEKYSNACNTYGIKQQEDYLISKFKPYLDFTRSLEERVKAFLNPLKPFYSYNEALKELEIVNLKIDVMPNGKEYRYGNKWLQRTMNPIDLASFVNSWNTISHEYQKIELINCPNISENDNTIKSLLDLGNEFYDNLKARDDKSISIEEI